MFRTDNQTYAATLVFYNFMKTNSGFDIPDFFNVRT